MEHLYGKKIPQPQNTGTEKFVNGKFFLEVGLLFSFWKLLDISCAVKHQLLIPQSQAIHS